jgi:hypothetical protein
MKNSIDLENLWSTITYEPESDFSYKIIDSRSKPTVNIGLDSAMNRCLILELPNGYVFDIDTLERQNLTLKYFNSANSIVLILSDMTYKALFSDLVLSLYESIKEITDPQQYTSMLVSTFHKWSEFFDPKFGEQLLKHEVKGLLGEMIVLERLLIADATYRCDEILESWKGPFDSNHDFVSDRYLIEVKTKDLKGCEVFIASEYQLDIVDNENLELYVLSVLECPQEGLSLREQTQVIRGLISERLGDTAIFLKALRQMNITPENIGKYDNLRFKPVKIDIYDCLDEAFPKIVYSKISNALGSIKYKINLNTLDEYLLSSEEL